MDPDQQAEPRTSAGWRGLETTATTSDLLLQDRTAIHIQGDSSKQEADHCKLHVETVNKLQIASGFLCRSGF